MSSQLRSQLQSQRYRLRGAMFRRLLVSHLVVAALEVWVLLITLGTTLWFRASEARLVEQ